MVHFFSVLHRYLYKQFLLILLTVCVIIGFIIGVFEFVEVLKSGTHVFYYDLQIIFINIVRKLYQISVYLIFLAFTVLFLKLKNNKELLAYNHLGFSVFQIFSGFISLLFLLFLLDIYNLDQFVAYLEKKLSFIKRDEVAKKNYVVNVSSQGIWLRDTDFEENRYIYAKRIILDTNELQDAKLIILDQDGHLKDYFTVSKMFLKDKKWDFYGVKDLSQNPSALSHKKTVLMPNDINVFSQNYIPFNRLKVHIKLFKKLGLTVDYLKLSWHKIVLKFLYWVIVLFLSFLLVQFITHQFFIYISVLFLGVSIYLISEIIYAYVSTYYIKYSYLLWVFPTVCLCGELLVFYFFRLMKKC